MGFWDDVTNAVNAVGNAINDAAQAVGDAVNTVVNAVGDAVSDVVEAVGNAVSDACDAIGGFLSGIPVIGGFLGGVFHWIGNVVASVTDLVGAVVKGITSIVGGVLGGVIKIVGGLIGGLLSGNWNVFADGWGNIVTGIAGAVIGIVGKFIGVVQTIFGLQWGKRALTRAEQDMLMLVFRNSVGLYNVRVVDGFAGLYSINSRPFTLGNTIYMKDTMNTPGDYNHTLVHECTHVWQYQNLGYKYTMEALWAQWTLPGQGYSWQDEMGRGKTRWQDFDREAEAAFIEDVWQSGSRGKKPVLTGDGVFYTDDPIGSDVNFTDSGTDRTQFAKDSIAYMRGFLAIRLTNLFS